MQVRIYKDAATVAKAAAAVVADEITKKDGCVIGLATGSTPVPTYQELIRLNKEGVVDFSKVISYNLDEYVGLAPDHPCSYRRFMNEQLFDHINIDKANTYVAKGTGDIEENLREFNAVLDRTDIDVQVLGVGPDGHLGFNEPGDTLCDSAHKEVLDESTIDANQRFFASRDDVPRYALTMGMGNEAMGTVYNDVLWSLALLLLLMSGNGEEDQNFALLTLGLYLFL